MHGHAINNNIVRLMFGSNNLKLEKTINNCIFLLQNSCTESVKRKRRETEGKYMSKDWEHLHIATIGLKQLILIHTGFQILKKSQNPVPNLASFASFPASVSK